MKKHYAAAALAYGVLALACGVFYREFTKLSGFTGVTALSGAHTHYLTLGAFFFLLLLALDRDFTLAGVRRIRGILLCYHVGLNLALVMMLVRGVFQVQGAALSSGADAAVSGVAGIGHMLLGVSLVILLSRIRRQAAKQ